MKHRPLGRTGLLVSELCFGAMTSAGVSGLDDRAPGRRSLAAAV